MPRLLEVAVLVQCAILSVGKLIVTQPEYRSIENTDAPFGYIPYGHKLKGRVYYAGDCCGKALGKNLRRSLGNNLIVLADRGHCSIAQKIEHAERVGAEAVIIADNTLEPLMIDDGTNALSPVNVDARDLGNGKSVSIPSIFVNKTEGDWLKQQAAAIAEISWLADRTSEVVKLELWDSIFDGKYSQLSKSSSVELFAKISLAMGQAVQFIPRYFLIPGESWFQEGQMWDCQKSYDDKKSPCYSQCTNRGQYCLPNPSPSAVTGADLLGEDLRQMCIHEWAYANRSDLWWRYIVALEQECENELSQACSEKVMRKLDIDVGRIANCVDESGGADHDGFKNYLFEREIDLSKTTRIMSVPKLFVNDEPYWGGLDCPHPLSPATCGMLAKLCSAFTPASTPKVCYGVFEDANLFAREAPVIKAHIHLTAQIRAFAAPVVGGHAVALNSNDVVAVVACGLMVLVLVVAVVGVAQGRSRSNGKGKGSRRRNNRDYDLIDPEGDIGLTSNREYTKVITAHSKKGQWKEAMSVLDTMKTQGITPDAYHYAGVMTACAKGRNFKMALKLLDVMQVDGVKPDTWVFNCAITACEKANQWKKAIGLLQGMEEQGLKPDVVSYSATISACAQGRKWEKSLELLDTMQKNGLKPDLITYNAAISSCEKGCQWEKALELLSGMRKGRDTPQPDVISCNAAISACEKCGQWQQAIALLSTMKDHYNVAPNVISYNAAISACEKAGQWKKALDLLAKMQSDTPGVPKPDLISYNAAISACEKGGQWKRSLQLLEFMQSSASVVVPDVISYNATISSCEKGAQWEKALELLGNMQKAGVHPNVVTFSAAISACEKGGQWQRALRLLRDMSRAKIVADVIAYRAAIVACGRSGQWQEADRVYTRAVDDGVMTQTSQSTTEGQEGMTLELAGSPAAVVVTALRHTLFSLVSQNKDKLQDLYLKTESATISKKKQKKMAYPGVSPVEVGDILKTLRPHPLTAETVTESLIKVSKADLLCWLDAYKGTNQASPMAM